MTTPCPNEPPCKHSAWFHHENVLAQQVECTAADNVIDDWRKPFAEQVYTQVLCPCGRPSMPAQEATAP